MTSGDMMLALLAGTGALCVILSFSLGPAVSQKSLWITSEVSMPLTLLTQLNKPIQFVFEIPEAQNRK